jgi:predicted AlkP superfamily phosphohydrolase/phosphomutase
LRTFLVGLDGATFTVLDSLVEAGLMPNLERFYRHGTRTELRSTPIPITPQAWTSMATGRSAGQHGLHDFVRFEVGERGIFLRINSSRDNHCETIWRRASSHGRRVTVLNYFGTAPPEPINGHCMPGFTSGRHLRRSSHSSDLFERLRGVDGLDIKILGMDLDIERQGLQEMEQTQWLDWIAHHVRREQVWFSVLRHLAATEPSDLTAIVFDGVDKIQHLAYPYLDPSTLPANPSAWERQVMSACRGYFERIDEYLGQIVEMAGAWGRVFIASDHGFTASREVFYVNTWLHEQGYLAWRSDTPVDRQQAQYSASLGADVNAIDPSASRAYALAPSSNGICINVPAPEYESFRKELTEKLFQLKGPDGGAVVTDVKKREECLPGPFVERIPDLILTLRDHGFISVLRGEVPVVPRRALLGTHHPQGVLLGMGPGIRAEVRLSGRDILDVAPLLMHSLGLAIPAEYEGAFPSDFYEPGYLASDPPRIAAENASVGLEEPPSSQTLEGVMEAEDEAVIVERLRSLGYLE